ncbi:hypothetical protein [Pseudomonas syringae]|uniref:hypothetical protein n=1 Tax=Pseudomonas syringae TaxID=317 RepID=UPI0018E6202F|nr:hypothetical protein [Pseudomonas syringae]MBI6794658.1 hypothetical protein [Pseudomonas syringae]
MPLQLKKYEVVLPDEVSLALVITGGTGPHDQRHTGFLVKDLMGGCRLFHLGGNNRYMESSFTPRYHYLLIPRLEPEVEMPIIGFLYYLMKATKGRIAYSVVWSDDESFDGEGLPITADASDGFTCATFVLETLRRYAFDLVDRSTWPLTTADAVWQRGILDVAELSSEQFLAQVEKVGKFPRFRPEHALGAAHYYTGDKLPFSIVSPAGDEVVQEMGRLSV